MADTIAASRDKARKRADATLREKGFSMESDESYLGELTNHSKSVAVRLILPPKFPDEAPIISVQDTASLSRRAHVERSGKLCLFPQTALLIDSSRPEQIVLDSLERAKSLLFEDEDDYKAEFLAYWHERYESEVLFLSSDLNRPHSIVAAKTVNGFLVVDDSSDSLQEWLRRVGWQAVQFRNAFLLPLSELPDAPVFNSISKHRDIQNILKHYAEIDDRTAFNAWLRKDGLPALLFLSAPAAGGTGRVIFAAEFHRAAGKVASRLHKGFRLGKMPASLELARSANERAVRIEPRRADANYLISRVGGNAAFLSKSLMIVGCGALGSQIAVGMAASGVGEITLVDHELLSADNVHRHVLGISNVRENKANALRDHLLARFPHLTIHAVPDDFETAFSNQPNLLVGRDLVILATGDETLERRLNTLFDPSLRRIHGWLEPLGVGGHALLTGTSSCFCCVFDRDESGLFNQTSLVQRGQDFLRNTSGCTSTFTPFGFIDAAQGAIEVTRLALDALRNDNAPPKIVSWIGDPSEFHSADYKLSKRGDRVLAHGRIIDTSYGRRDCEFCRDQ